MAQPIAWMGGKPLDSAQYPPTRPFAHHGNEEVLDDPNQIGINRDPPQLSRLPSYATTDPNSAPAYSAPIASNSSSSPRLSDQVSEIQHSKPGLTVNRADTDEVLYYIGRYSAQNTPDVVIYNGPSSRSPICAQARLTNTKDLGFLVGSSEDPAAADWSIAKNISEGRIFSSDSWHFSLPRSAELAWKQTHDAHLGSGKFRSKDFKLVDAVSESVLAVYLDAGPTDISTVGRLEFKQALASAEAELAALAVLMVIRERSRRHNQRSGVVNRSQDVALRHGI